MTHKIAKGSFDYWLSVFSREGKGSDVNVMEVRPLAIAFIKRQTQAVIKDALDKAMEEAFGGTPPYDISDLTAPALLVNFADQAIHDPDGPYGKFIKIFLTEFDLIEDPKPEAPKAPMTSIRTKPHASSKTPEATRSTSPAQVAKSKPRAKTEFELKAEKNPAGLILHELWEETHSLDVPGLSTSPDRIGSGELMRLPGILPPPPSCEKGDDYGKWLSGEIWHPLAFGLHLAVGPNDLDDDLIEMQSEFYAMPDAARDTYGARPPASPEAENSIVLAQSLYRAGYDCGFRGWTLDRAAEEFKNAVARYYQEFEPVSADFLERVGYSVRLDEQLLWVVACALDIEAYYLETGPQDADEGGLQDLRGTLSSRKRLDAPVVLDRAMVLHFFSGKPLTTGLAETLRELRHAQICRYLGKDITPGEFDSRYETDWLFELEEYFPDQDADLEVYPE